jgi:hypothetical protein
MSVAACDDRTGHDIALGFTSVAAVDDRRTNMRV